MAIWDNWSIQNIGASVLDAAGLDSFASTLGSPTTPIVDPQPAPTSSGDLVGSLTAPMDAFDAFNTTVSVDPSLSTGGTVDGTTAPTAPTSAQLTGVQSEIMQRAEAANAIFKTLMGGVDKVLADRRGTLEKSSRLTQEQLQRQAQTEGEAASGQFSSRGLTDSSFRAKALGDIGQEHARLSGQELSARDAELAALGQFGTTKKAAFTEDNASAQRAIQTAQELVTSGTFSDLASLQSLRDSLDVALGKSRVEEAGLQTQEGFLGQLTAVAPGTSRFAGLSEQLTRIAQSATPAELKEQMIQGLISSDTSLTDEEKQELLGTFLTPLGA